MAGRLADIGLVHIYWSSTDAPPTAMRSLPPIRSLKRKRYQCVIASRWPVTADGNRWRRCAPYPELLARATVSVPGEQDIDVFTVHIPNGSGNGWRKIDTFNVLSAALLRGIDSPRILTGDFNEPKRFRQSGQIVPMVCATPIVTFTALRRPPPSHTTRRKTTRDVSTTPSSQGTSRLRTAATTTNGGKRAGAIIRPCGRSLAFARKCRH